MIVAKTVCIVMFIPTQVGLRRHRGCTAYVGQSVGLLVTLFVRAGTQPLMNFIQLYGHTVYMCNAEEF